MSLSIDNLLVSIGVAYDLQLKAADNLFYAAAVQIDDPSKPMFGGSTGTATACRTCRRPRRWCSPWC